MDDFIDISLLHHKLLGTLSPEEEEIFQKWYEECGEHRVYFERFRLQYAKTVNREVSDVDTVAALQRIHKKQRFSLNVYKIRAIAAVAIILLGIGLQLLYSDFTTKQSVEIAGINAGRYQAILKMADGKKVFLDSTTIVRLQDSLVLKDCGINVFDDRELIDTGFNELIVPLAGEYRMILEDGTEVFLNASTKLKYPVRFRNGERRVFLDGEAYFRVAHKGEPFIVETMKGEVKVFGTEFNVMTYSDEPEIQTTLVEGSVGVSLDGISFQKILPNEQFVIHRESGKTEIRQVDVSVYMAWKDGMFISQNDNLESILKKVARWYDVEIFYQDQQLKKKRFFGIMKRQCRLEEVLEIIAEAGGIQFSVEGRVVVVLKK